MSTSAIDKYLQDLDAALAGIPASAKQSILDDVRAHAEDALETGREPDDVVAALGSPTAVADSAREELGVQGIANTTDDGTRAERILHWAALALAVVTAVLITFLLPLYTTSENPGVGEGVEESVYATSTLFEALGIGIGLLPLIPASVTLLPLVLPAGMRSIAGWAAAVIVTIGAVVTGLTLGGFFIPIALLLWSAMLVPIWIRRGRHTVSGRVWRTVAAIVLFLPALVAFSGLITGSLQDPSPSIWIAAIIVTALTVLFACRVRFIDLAIAGLGAALMLLGIFDGGMLILALWWAGGLWLVIGFSAAVAKSRRTT